MSILWLSSPTILYSVYMIIRLNFFSIKKYRTLNDVYLSQPNQPTLQPGPLYTYTLLVFVMLFITSATYTIFAQTLFQTFSNTSTSLIILALCLTLSMMHFYQSSTYLQSMSLLYIMLTVIFASTTNLYQFYLILEITAYLNLLFIALISHNDNSVSTHYALIVTFILNFLASILLFSTFTYTTYRLAYPLWQILEYSENTWVVNNVATTAILIKMGVGVWLIGNSYTYKGYSLSYLLVYAIGNILILTPILLFLVSVYSNTLVIFISIIGLFLIISNTIHAVTSLKSLFAYSTAIFQTYLLLIILF
jgi:hypothetical protein